jgi:Bacterial PH domain
VASPIELQPGEQQVLLCRRHWIALYPLLILDALIAFVPVGLVLWAASRTEGETATQIATVVSVVWVAAIGVRAYFHWYRYYHDVWLITNQRLIDSLRRHWFHRAVSSADLVDIQDVAMAREGLLQTALDFGDLNVQTASEQQRFVLAKIPDPAAVLTILDRARDDARKTARTA